METSNNGVGFVKQCEGLRTAAYQDVVGKWTTGYGHLIRLPYEEYFKDMPISEAIAENLLRVDLKQAEECVLKNVRVPLDQCQFDALVDFIFNLGCAAFERSTLLFLLNNCEYNKAADQFLRWDKANGRVIPGLAKRREKERKLFLEGSYE